MALKKSQLEAALANWPGLNEALRAATEEEAAALLRAERGGKRRVQYLMRIHGRFNRERARRERAELLGSKGS